MTTPHNARPVGTPFTQPFDPAHPLSEVAPELCRALEKAGLTPQGLLGLLGPHGVEALYRGEPGAIPPATESHGITLLRVFFLHEPIAADRLAEVLGEPTLVSKLCDARAFVAVPGKDGADSHLRCVVDIRAHVVSGRQVWVWADVDASLVDHVPGPEHVLGVGAASLSLLGSVPTDPVDSVLDIGTGSGIQLLGQADSATTLVGTDLHARALDFAAASLTASGASAELLQGPWFEPVAGRRFSRIVANPPFVVGVPEVGHVYRDSGLNLDGASELVVSQAADYLEPGGTAHLLAAWVHRADEAWEQRVARWLPNHGVTAWVMQRDVADPALYVSTWLRDESIDPRSAEGVERTRVWLEHFRRHEVTGIGFGFVAVQRIADDAPSEVIAEDLSQPFTDPLGPEVAEHFARAEWLRNSTADDVANSRFVLRPGVAREEVQVADIHRGMGFEPAALRLTRTDGPRFSHDVDKHVAAVVAGLHPEGLPLGEVAALYAVAHGLDDEAFLDELIPLIVDLMRHGIVIPQELVP